ncbi:MAG: hypothetical protein M1347_00785 [Chloroflexi bacterium]|nr:hypothetical protein [Chloroflexota bacterium]
MYDINDFKINLSSFRFQLKEAESRKLSKEFDSIIHSIRGLLTANANNIDEVLQDPSVRSIQLELQKCVAQHFYRTEKEWAIRIINSRLPKRAIRKFPDYVEYKARTYFELKTVSEKEVNHILFVGSGPVPITPIFLAEKSIYIDCVEISNEACNLANSLTIKLELEKYIRYFPIDILKFRITNVYDVVWVAVLAGETNEEKASVVHYLYDSLDKGQTLILRTGHGPGKMLYAEAKIDDIEGFDFFMSDQTPHSGFIQTYFVRKN